MIWLSRLRARNDNNNNPLIAVSLFIVTVPIQSAVCMYVCITSYIHTCSSGKSDIISYHCCMMTGNDIANDVNHACHARHSRESRRDAGLHIRRLGNQCFVIHSRLCSVLVVSPKEGSESNDHIACFSPYATRN